MIPLNLAVIIAVQAALCAVVHVVLKTPAARTPRYWTAAAWFGLTLGIIMDGVLGSYRLFAYLPQGVSSAAIQPRNLPFTTLLVNGVLSYGLAVATFGAVAHKRLVIASSARWIRASASLLSIGAAGIVLMRIGTLGMMLAWGVVILSFGELLLLVFGMAGPIVALLSGTAAAPFAKLWGLSIVVGATYEAANKLAPFWVWLPDSGHSQLLISLTMVLFGYVALSHPVLVYWALNSSGTEPDVSGNSRWRSRKAPERGAV